MLAQSLGLLFGQNYIDYFNSCNEADKQIYLDNDSAALEHFKSAFGSVEYVHAFQYEKASMCAARLEDYQAANLYAKNAILHGTPPKFLKRKVFKGFRKTNSYKSLRDSLSWFQNQHQNSINLDFKKEIDSLHYIDQRIIRKNKRVKGKYKIAPSTLPENVYELDSLIFAHLLTLINTHGFPSEKNIGPEGYGNVWVLFHHNVRLPQNAHYLPVLKEAVITGQYLPADYAWMYDQGLMFKGEKPLFYYAVASTGHLSESEKESIDEERRKLGIKPLASTEIKVLKNGISQKRLW